MARRDAEDPTAPDAGRGGVLGRLVLLTAVAGIGAYVLRRLRERQLDDVIWEEPPTA